VNGHKSRAIRLPMTGPYAARPLVQTKPNDVEVLPMSENGRKLRFAPGLKPDARAIRHQSRNCGPPLALDCKHA
jgi:hypothetical protein